MAEQKKAKRPQLTSPRGVFKFPRLNAPDTKFKADGEYTTKLLLTAEAAKPFIEKLTPHYDEAIKKGKAKYAELPPATKKKNPFKEVPFYSDDLDKEGNETGLIQFNFKLPATGEDKKTGKKWVNKVALFDAKGQPMAKAPQIWGGTEGVISFEVSDFLVPAIGAGLSFRLKAAQIVKLVQGGDRDAESYGFGAEEDGYSYEEPSDDDLSSGDDASGEGSSGDDASGEQDF